MHKVSKGEEALKTLPRWQLAARNCCWATASRAYPFYAHFAFFCCSSSYVFSSLAAQFCPLRAVFVHILPGAGKYAIIFSYSLARSLPDGEVGKMGGEWGRQVASSKSANDADDEGNEIIKSKLFTKLTLTHWAKTNRQNEAAERKRESGRERRRERGGEAGRSALTTPLTASTRLPLHTAFALHENDITKLSGKPKKVQKPSRKGRGERGGGGMGGSSLHAHCNKMFICLGNGIAVADLGQTDKQNVPQCDEQSPKTPEGTQ